MGGTPVPPAMKDIAKTFGQYVPESRKIKFLRYQLADFQESEAQALAELTYDELIERKWLKSAHNKAINDEHERIARTRKQPNTV